MNILTIFNNRTNFIKQPLRYLLTELLNIPVSDISQLPLLTSLMYCFRKGSIQPRRHNQRVDMKKGRPLQNTWSDFDIETITSRMAVYFLNWYWSTLTMVCPRIV